RGYVFKDKWLNDYFNQLWWYMPDPTWQASSSDFTPREWKLIREESKSKKKVRRRKR
ncbi:MAG: YARHG domain-containing protein, partial [Prevotella sp.]|nr:YARHG domain-containing protein [Prevotella sp.]